MCQMLDTPRNPAEMTPSQRRREIAALLARGVLRLRQCAPVSTDSGESRPGEKVSEAGPTRLDESPALSPYVATPAAVNAGENAKEAEPWG